MKSFGKFAGLATAIVLAGVMCAQRAEATPIISFNPSSHDATVGDNFSVDVVVSGLTEPTGAVSFLLGYDSSILDATAFTPDPNGVMGVALDPLNNATLFTPGVSPIDSFFVADLSLSPAQLAAAESTGFTLATVNFTAITPGLSPLTLVASPQFGALLGDYTGQINLGAQAVNGSVCVGDVAGVPGNCATAAVPEPATFALLATGLAAAVRRRRNRRA